MDLEPPKKLNYQPMIIMKIIKIQMKKYYRKLNKYLSNNNTFVILNWLFCNN